VLRGEIHLSGLRAVDRSAGNAQRVDVAARPWYIGQSGAEPAAPLADVAGAGDLSDIVIANLAARYHDPAPVGIGSVLALWSMVALAIVGGRRLQRVIPLRWIARLAALAMVVMAGFTLAEALR
jgi:hypothetical protein